MSNLQRLHPDDIATIVSQTVKQTVKQTVEKTRAALLHDMVSVLNQLIEDAVDKAVSARIEGLVIAMHEDVNMLRDLMAKTWHFVDGEYVLTANRVKKHDHLLRLQGDRLKTYILHDKSDGP